MTGPSDSARKAAKGFWHRWHSLVTEDDDLELAQLLDEFAAEAVANYSKEQAMATPNDASGSSLEDRIDNWLEEWLNEDAAFGTAHQSLSELIEAYAAARVREAYESAARECVEESARRGYSQPLSQCVDCARRIRELAERSKP